MKLIILLEAAMNINNEKFMYSDYKKRLNTMDFKNIPQKYRPIPFWSWNEKLNSEETKSQVQMMHQVGIGGFFMHARCGLQTEYMGKDWFNNATSAIDEAKKCGMRPWAYDENGWPSGFGDGKVNDLGIDYPKEMARIQQEMKELMQREKDSQIMLAEAFKGIGYEIE